MSATDDMQNRFRTLQRRIDQLGRAIGVESALLVRSIGWNVLASLVPIIAHTYDNDGKAHQQTLERLFEEVTSALLQEKHVRGCRRCAGPVVQQDATLACLECALEEDLDVG